MSLFIAALLFSKRSKALNDKILGSWMFVIALHLSGFYINQESYWLLFPHLIGVTAPLPLLHGPLLYLYTLYSLRGDKKIRYVDYLHFIPAVISYLYMSNFFFFYSEEQKLSVDNGEINDFNLFSGVLLVMILLSGISYAILAYRLTIKHKIILENRYSFREGVSLRWLRISIVGIGLVFCLAILIFIFKDDFELVLPFNSEYVFYTIMILFIFYFGYYGIRHENIFAGNSSNIPTSTDNFREKYRNSGLSYDQSIALHNKLISYMLEYKPFLNPRLTLSDLSKMLGCSPNQLSQVINQHSVVNFHDFINKYRVEEFIERAQNNKGFKLLSIAMESGFNSKSSFNTIFKKHTGLTPSGFLKGVDS